MIVIKDKEDLTENQVTEDSGKQLKQELCDTQMLKKISVPLKTLKGFKEIHV